MFQTDALSAPLSNLRVYRVSGPLLRSRRCCHELRAHRIGDRLPHNLLDGFQRGSIQIPTNNIRSGRQLARMMCSPKGNGDEWLIQSPAESQLKDSLAIILLRKAVEAFHSFEILRITCA